MDKYKSMSCNKPQKSWRKGKKKVVKVCDGKNQKIIHFGASGYGNNYSKTARDSFRARHKCDTANDKFTARYWACENLWTKGGNVTKCPSNRKCKFTRKKSSNKKSSRKKSSRKKSSNKKSSRKKSSRKKSSRKKSYKHT
jgi:hypothetical protein